MSKSVQLKPTFNSLIKTDNTKTNGLKGRQSELLVWPLKLD